MSTGGESGRTTLVTGASSGIGREIARVAADHGDDLVVTARSEDRLEALATALRETHGVAVTVVTADLARAEAADELAAAVAERGLTVDTLVNNAGVPVYGEFATDDPAAHDDLVALNVATPTALTRRFVGGMCDRGDGRVLNVASVAGVVPTPGASTYAASKAYLLSFSVGLAAEVADDGVTVTALCPRETDTGFMERGGVEESGLSGVDAADPAAVARAGYEGLLAGERVVVPDLKATALFELPRLLPWTWRARVAGDYWAGDDGEG
jgi:short-subunit dehydrogenase